KRSSLGTYFIVADGADLRALHAKASFVLSRGFSQRRAAAIGMDRYPTAFVGHIRQDPPRSRPVTTLTRWKLSCALLAALAGVATVRAHRSSADHNAPAKLATSPR